MGAPQHTISGRATRNSSPQHRSNADRPSRGIRNVQIVESVFDPRRSGTPTGTSMSESAAARLPAVDQLSGARQRAQ
jgi:hypothetical protein